MTTSRRTRLLTALLPVVALTIGAAVAVPSVAGVPTGGNAVKLTAAKTAELARQIRANNVSKTAYNAQKLCGTTTVGGKKRTLACRTERLADSTGRAILSGVPAGLGAAELQQVYGASSMNPNATIVIYASGDGGNLAADVEQYRAAMGLQSCTSCLQVIPYTGNAPVASIAEWGGEESWNLLQESVYSETALDAEMVTAICSTCRIQVRLHPLEAAFGGLGDVNQPTTWSWRTLTNVLLEFLAQAKAAGAAATSISFGYPIESAPQQTKDALAAVVPAMPTFASSGDAGWVGDETTDLFDGSVHPPVEDWPAASSHVVAVGGTSLYSDPSSARGYTEIAWNGSGSTCAKDMASVTGQPAEVSSVCDGRATSDVSAVADPFTGPAVYDSYSPYWHSPGWIVVGGTSVSTPIVAALYASSSVQKGTTYNPYTAPSTAFTDVTLGVNAYPNQCNTILCAARAGWDGPTGVGTPANAYAAFNKPMRLFNVATGLCLNLGAGGSASVATTSSCNATTTRVTPLFRGVPGSTAVPITIAGANTCLGVVSGSTQNGAQLASPTCVAGSAQQWTLSPVAGSTLRFVVKNLNSGRCADVDNHRTTSGAKVTQGTCNGTPAVAAFQQWQLLAQAS